MGSQWNAIQEIYPVSRETFERLEFFVDRVKSWQRKTNLIAPSTMDEIWERHIADSLQCVQLKPNARHWVDVGSGGGFPALVIAAVLAEYDGASITLIESNQKKCAFLRQTARQMNVPANVICGRIEAVSADIPVPEIVTARALADLSTLLKLAQSWLQKGAVGLFHKGREYRRELAETHGKWQFDLIEYESKISSDSILLEISNLNESSNIS